MQHLYSTKEFEDKFTYMGSDLGASWTENSCQFRVWAPTAKSISVCLFASGKPDASDCIGRFPMLPSKNGTWVAKIDGNLNGVYYTYAAATSQEEFQTYDPYAKAAGVNGKRSMVVDFNCTNPDGWEKDCDPNAALPFQDCIIYEMHLRDISCGVGSGIRNKGKFLGAAETGTKNREKKSTGLDHIKSLGVTHVHILPFYDYGSVDESDPKRKQYNWGYDPLNFNIPEGSYSTDPFDGFTRIRELKQMIQALHCNGLSVIMDVVYNHVYHSDEFSFNRLVPGYFSRTTESGSYSNGSGCGNDTASERSMVRKYIVDSVNHWADEYHIDGFRFDLVGLIDTETVQEIINTVHSKHPNVKFYGEGWDMYTCMTKPNVPLTTQKNSALVPKMAFFNDTSRDTLRGPFYDSRLPGYVSGKETSKEELLECFSGRTAWTNHPNQIINYVSCHDDHTIFDRISIALPDASVEELAKRNRLAAAFTILGLGIPFFQAGEEMLRSKHTRTGRIVPNSYRSPDYVNGIKWNTLNDPNVSTTVAYYRGLIAIKKAHSLLRMTDPLEIRSAISLHPTSNGVTAFRLISATEQMLIAFNAGTTDAEIALPQGEWNVIVKDNVAGISSLESVSGNVNVSSISTLVLEQHR